MSIEDDLRELLAPNTGIPVYSRQFPQSLPESYCIQRIGGRTNSSNIRREVAFISIMACASRLETAKEHLDFARNFFTTHLPADINGRHYYLGVPLADGEIMLRPPRHAYIYHVTLEVTAEL